jgi:hypothetical protein
LNGGDVWCYLGAGREGKSCLSLGKHPAKSKNISYPSARYINIRGMGKYILQFNFQSIVHGWERRSGEVACEIVEIHFCIHNPTECGSGFGIFDYFLID